MEKVKLLEMKKQTWVFIYIKEQILKHFTDISLSLNFLFLKHVFLPFTGRLSAVNYRNLQFTDG